VGECLVLDVMWYYDGDLFADFELEVWRLGDGERVRVCK